MSRFTIFVDTGLKGAAVCFRENKPYSYHRFKKCKVEQGIEVKPFIDFLKAFRTKTKHPQVIYESPSKINRHVVTVSSQYYVIGQIVTAARLTYRTSPTWVPAVTWISFVKRKLGKPFDPDPKTRSRQYASQLFGPWLLDNFKPPYPDGITDCLCLASYVQHEEKKLIKFFEDQEDF